MFGGLGLHLWFRVMVTFWVNVSVRVSVRVSVSVNYFRDSFSLLLHAQHYSMLPVRHRNHSLSIIDCWL